MEGIGWRFPLTNGGTEDGYNNPGMAHFAGSPLGSLARETIQNSLDAKTDSANDVQVVFDLVRVKGLGLGQEQLVQHVSACLPVAKDEKDVRAVQELQRALHLLEKDEITFLRVADYNTIGLDGERWKALVKSQGSSHKQDRIAGGSHGIGKYAPFVVSQLRTVFYWSRSGTTKWCQGKAVLMSHDVGGGTTRGEGFFGVTEGCEKLEGRDIPQDIEKVERKRTGPGTSLWIAGFSDERGWQIRVAQSVVESYFCAIAEARLEVLVEPAPDGSMFEINRDTLAHTFDGLLSAQKNFDDDGDALKEAYDFYRALEGGESIVKEREDKDLGHCKLWILVGEGLPRKVGLIRKTGMLITSKQDKLLQFRNLQDFVAVLRFESEQGNELLRDMENPEHDQFQPNRLLDDLEKRRGRRALNRIVEWVRRELREVAAVPTTGAPEMVSELARLLPDIEPDESFGDGEGVEQGFGTKDVIQLRPIRRTRNASLPDESGDDAGDDGERQEGSAGPIEREREGNGGVPGDAGGDEDSTGDSGAIGGGRARSAVSFSDFRLLAGAGDGIRVAFTPTEDAKAVRLDLAEAGDSNVVRRSDLRVVVPGGVVALAAHSLDFKAGQRVVLEVVGDEPLDGRAWRLQPVIGDIGAEG